MRRKYWTPKLLHRMHTMIAKSVDNYRYNVAMQN